MTYDTPYRVETTNRLKNSGRVKTVYTLVRSGEGDLVEGTDLAFMHRICELLNADENSSDIHR